MPDIENPCAWTCWNLFRAPGRLGPLVQPMPIVETTTWINAPIDTVYAVARQNEAFPEFMKDVKSVTVVERGEDRVVSDWIGIVATFGLKIKWRQEDIWDDSTHQCHFKMLSGDYDRLEGTWTFSEQEGGTQFDSRVDYEYKVPGIGALVYKVIHNLVVKNLDDTLAAIKARSESLSVTNTKAGDSVPGRTDKT